MYKEELVKQAQDLGIDPAAYAFLPPVQKRAIPSLLQQVDASYVGAAQNPIFRFGVGMNKLFDAMMGGKPILYAVEAPNNLVEEYKCGITVEAVNIAALKLGLEKLLKLSEEERQEMGERGRKAILAHFTYPVLAREFIKAAGLE